MRKAGRLSSYAVLMAVSVDDLVAGDLPFKGDLAFKAVFPIMPAPRKPLPRAGVRTGHYVGLRRGNSLAPFVMR